MSCITVSLFPAEAPRVAEGVGYEITKPCGICTRSAQNPPLAINWQVVTDEQGRRRLEMRWKAQTATT